VAAVIAALPLAIAALGAPIVLLAWGIMWIIRALTGA
jgi:hypothetical protein